MTDLDYAHLALVIDRSGSMASCRRDMEGGLNTYLDAQRALPGRCTVTYAQFDNAYEIVFANRPIAEVPRLFISPRGGTALLDAIGRTITVVGEDLARLPEDQRPGSVEVVVVTDGEENSSTEWTIEAVRALITQQQDVYAWKITFLGANIDAVATAGAFGIPLASAMTFDSHQAVGTYTIASTASAAFRGARAKGASYGAAVADAAFSDEDRAQAMGEDPQPSKR